MTARPLPLHICVLVIAVLVGGGTRSLWAQDRGAPRFRPSKATDTVEAEASDAGRLWSVATPPFSRFEERYGMKPDSAWATHLRRGLLRLSGCTGALVSAQGLAVTAARCVRRHLESDPSPEHVVTAQPSEEQSLSGLHADRLLAASDVTAEVRAAKQEHDSLDRAVQAVRERLQSDTDEGRRVEIEEGPGGPRYTAYTYRRSDDVRVAFLPERAISAYGGLDAAFTYPRSALDVALLRIYTPDGTPLEPDHFFETSSEGLRPGDPVFSVGHSTGTRRAESVEQLAFRRDVVLPRRLAVLDTWTGAVQEFLDSAEGGETRWRAALAEGQRIQKNTQARLEALQNDYLQNRLRQRDEHLRKTLAQDPAFNQQFGGLLDSLAALQAAKRDLRSAYSAFWGLESGTYRSLTLQRALRAHRASEAEAGRRDSLWQRVAQGKSQPTPVDAALLTSRLERIRDHLAPDTAAVRQLLGGATPKERASAVVEGSVLSQSEGVRTLQEGGADVPADDPALSLVDAFASEYRSFREEWEALKQSERPLTRRLARARAKVSPEALLPAREGAPRLTEGRLLGYPYNGTLAPPLTTIHGLYSRRHSFGRAGAWRLPDTWESPPQTLDRSIPLTLAVSTDGAAGTNGAPLLNQYLEIVGVTFGTNIQGTAGTYLFLPERMRTVALDLRGLRQALTKLYEADALVDELFGGTSGSDEASP